MRIYYIFIYTYMLFTVYLCIHTFFHKHKLKARKSNAFYIHTHIHICVCVLTNKIYHTQYTAHGIFRR